MVQYLLSTVDQVGRVVVFWGIQRVRFLRIKTSFIAYFVSHLLPVDPDDCLRKRLQRILDISSFAYTFSTDSLNSCLLIFSLNAQDALLALCLLYSVYVDRLLNLLVEDNHIRAIFRGKYFLILCITCLWMWAIRYTTLILRTFFLSQLVKANFLLVWGCIILNFLVFCIENRVFYMLARSIYLFLGDSKHHTVLDDGYYPTL